MKDLQGNEDDKKISGIFQISRRKGQENVPVDIIKDIYGYNIRESFIENIGQRLKELDDEVTNQLDLLEDIGIIYNDSVVSNFVVCDGKLNVIDFPQGRIDSNVSDLI